MTDEQMRELRELMVDIVKELDRRMLQGFEDLRRQVDTVESQVAEAVSLGYQIMEKMED